VAATLRVLQVFILFFFITNCAAAANAMMTRISLVCKVAAPVLFGVVLYVSNINAVSLPQLTI